MRRVSIPRVAAVRRAMSEYDNSSARPAVLSESNAHDEARHCL